MMHPEKVGPYEILKVLGKGSMGTVFQAHDPRFDRVVALKTISQESLDVNGEGYMARFIQEAKAAGRLNHPGIVTVHDFSQGEGDTMPYLAMEYVEGTTLDDMLQDEILLPAEQVAAYIRDLADALGHAHDRGVVHRDLKPANIILTNQGQIKLMDFGIARMDASEITHHGQLVGTPSYMSPEQIKGEKIDGRADIFGLGVLFYYLLSGSKPFSGQDVSSVLYKISHSDYLLVSQRKPELPESLDAILSKMLAKDPVERYADCHALADDLDTFLNTPQDPEATQPTGMDPLAEEKPQPFPLKLLFLFVVLLGAAGLLLWQDLKAPTEELPVIRANGGEEPKPNIPGPVPPSPSAGETDEPVQPAEEQQPEMLSIPVQFKLEHRLTQGSFYLISGKDILFSRKLDRKKSQVFNLDTLSFKVDLPEGSHSLQARLVFPNREQPVDANFQVEVKEEAPASVFLKYAKVRRKFEISGKGVKG